MDKMSMEELGFFLYMEEMERQQEEEQTRQAGADRTEANSAKEGHTGPLFA